MSGRHDLPDFFRPVLLDETTSTNDEALARLRDGAPEGTLVVARRQTAGRGRRGRRWESPAGNLHLSLILAPPGGRGDAGAVGFAASLAVADGIAPLLAAESRVALKWPNDVLVNGRKVAGILIEKSGEGPAAALVLGVGVNVAAFPEDTPFPATSLEAEGAAGATVDAVLAAFAEAFLARYDGWRRDGFGPLREAWLGRAHGLGGPITVRLDGRRFDGTFREIDRDGALVLDLGGTTRSITAGDVFFAAAGP